MQLNKWVIILLCHCFALNSTQVLFAAKNKDHKDHKDHKVKKKQALIKKIGVVLSVSAVVVVGAYCIYAYLHHKTEPDNKIEPDNSILPNHPKNLTGDALLDAELEAKNHISGRKPNAGNGNCLFLSIAPQITEEDFEKARVHIANHQHLQAHYGQLTWSDWQKLSADERSDTLRGLAMAEEGAFFSALDSRQSADLSEEERIWIEEASKDFLQEIENVPSMQVPERTRQMSFEQKKEYIARQQERYRQATGRPKNWAGTTEYIALSKIFNRQVEAYGYDLASGYTAIQFNQDGAVLPYFRRMIGDEPPFRIFQTGGGGHYEGYHD